MSERSGQTSNRPDTTRLASVALAAWLAGVACVNAPGSPDTEGPQCRVADGQHVHDLEAEIARLRADLEQAERSLRDAASGLEQELTLADAVSALAEARVHGERAAQTAPWRRAELEEARLRLAEADRQIQGGHYGSAVFFATRARSIADRVSSEAIASRKVRRVRVRRANVRSGPSRRHAVVGVLPRDTAVLQQQVEGDWVQVKTPSGESAWIHRTLLESL